MLRVELQSALYVCDQPGDLVVCLTNADVGIYTNVVLRLVLPRELSVLSGTESIAIERLAPGQTTTHTLRIRPRNAGRWALTSPNFSYRDHFGRACRINDLHLEVVVQPASAPVAGPALQVVLHTAELPLGAWGLLEGQVINHSRATLRQLQVQIGGPVAAYAPWQSSGLLPVGTAAAFQLSVRASEHGLLPIRVEVIGTDVAGKIMRCEHHHRLRVSSAVATSAAGASHPPEQMQQLIYQHERRLQKLREKAARYGIAVDPSVITEIEDIEAEIARLRAQLGP